MDIRKLLKMTRAERHELTDRAAVALQQCQQRYDAKDYIADMLMELREVAIKARLQPVIKHIDAARRELHALPSGALRRRKGSGLSAPPRG